MKPTRGPRVYVVVPYYDVAIAKLQRHPRAKVILPHDSAKEDFLQETTIVLVRSETAINAAMIRDAHPGLEAIIKQGAGVDNIDIAAARRKGIQVWNTPGLNGEAVAELTITLAMCVARRTCEFDRLIRNGEKVVRSQMLGKSLFRKTVGIVGMGNIGLELAKKWHGAMGGKVVAFDPYSKDAAWSQELPTGSFQRVEELEELLNVADVVSLHVPLTPSTTYLISHRQFGQMKEGAMLINCARGGIVDELALLKALSSGHLYGAGLDAMQYEPPTAFAYGEALLNHSRVVMTPHVGASTAENQERSGLAAVDIAYALLDGDVENVPRPLV